MTQNEREIFEEFLLDSFAEGIHFRELRLSNEEKDFINKNYPTVRLKNGQTNKSSEGKYWYDVNRVGSNEEMSKNSTERNAKVIKK